MRAACRRCGAAGRDRYWSTVLRFSPSRRAIASLLMPTAASACTCSNRSRMGALVCAREASRARRSRDKPCAAAPGAGSRCATAACRCSTRRATSPAVRSRCKRSATWTAAGAPCCTPSAYSPPRSRLTTWTPGCSRSHAAPAPAERSGKRSTTRWRSRSTRIVPYVRPVRKAKSSTERTVGVKGGALVKARIASRSVSRLVAPPPRRSSRAPGAPPRAKATCTNQPARRVVRRAEGAATVGIRSVKICRSQATSSQKKRRACRQSRTATPPQGRSARVR